MAVEVAAGLLKDGDSLPKIMKISGLSEDAICKLAKDLGITLV